MNVQQEMTMAKPSIEKKEYLDMILRRSTQIWERKKR
jgi:hypothetical protein